MMLVAGFGISLPLHEVLHRHIRFSYRIENDMHMDVACGIMTVRVGADDYLMPGKILPGKIHGKRLSQFRGQSVFVPVPRVEADDVMVGFDIFPILIFVEEGIGGFALPSESEGVTAYALDQKLVTGYLISILMGFMSIITADADSAILGLIGMFAVLLWFSFSGNESMKRFLEILLIMLLSWRAAGFLQLAFPDKSAKTNSIMRFGSMDQRMWTVIAAVAVFYVLLQVITRKGSAVMMCIASYFFHNIFCYQRITCTPFIFVIFAAGMNIIRNNGLYSVHQ